MPAFRNCRLQAKNVGTLKSSPQQAVETKKTSSGEQVIVIEPTNPQIVYVPQYNTQVVYTQAPTHGRCVEEDDDADEAVAAGLIGFTAGIVIGATMDNNYYYGPYGWHGGGYMYNDAWDDYYDHREDAREDWMDHREDLVEERGDRRRTDRSSARVDTRSADRGAATTQEQRTDRQETRQENRQGAGATNGAERARHRAPRPRARRRSHNADRTGSAEARGYGDGSRSQTAQPTQRSSGSSDAFSGYSSGHRNARPVLEDKRAGAAPRRRRRRRRRR